MTLVKINSCEGFIVSLNKNDDILFFDEDFSKFTFFANQMGILVKLILMMIMIFRKIILRLLTMSDF